MSSCVLSIAAFSLFPESLIDQEEAGAVTERKGGTEARDKAQKNQASK